jgi:hypothetical protein
MGAVTMIFRGEPDDPVTESLQRPSPRQSEFYNPASALRASALSVASQVNSGSSRPKWP